MTKLWGTEESHQYKAKTKINLGMLIKYFQQSWIKQKNIQA